VLEAAEAAGAVLFFDEAAALFGKRSEVKDSQDRYANLEVSYLLQRMESYRGLAIATTNMQQALDPAFKRRLRFIVNFPFPEGAERAEIWRRVFLLDTPLYGVDVTRLAQPQCRRRKHPQHRARRSIRRGGRPVLLRAARTECAKLERLQHPPNCFCIDGSSSSRCMDSKVPAKWVRSVERSGQTR
jgi:vesicle-fusing ATPase